MRSFNQHQRLFVPGLLGEGLEVDDISKLYSDSKNVVEPLDVVFFNKVQSFAESQVELDRDFKIALDELASEIAKDKPTKPRFPKEAGGARGEVIICGTGLYGK